MRNKSKRQLVGLAVVAIAAVLIWKFGPWGKTTEQSPTTQPAAATQPGAATTQTAGATTKPAPTTQPAPKPVGVTAAQALAAYTSGVTFQEQGKKILAARGPQDEAHRNLLEARTLLSKALLSGQLDGETELDARSRATALAEQSILSRSILTGDPYTTAYTFKAGEVLQNVERNLKLHVPWRGLLRVNNLKSARSIREGQRLKMLLGPAHAIVTKSAFTMDIYLQREDLPKVFVNRLRVGVGKNGTTPVGLWRVALGKKMMNAPWNPPPNSPQQGKILFGSPGYPLGTQGYWISLEGIDETTKYEQGYGIHGTNDPASIGRAESLGCIRLADPDIELVFALLYEHWSTVEIRP